VLLKLVEPLGTDCTPSPWGTQKRSNEAHNSTSHESSALGSVVAEMTPSMLVILHLFDPHLDTHTERDAVREGDEWGEMVAGFWL
jgi:hypothetical protein